MNTLMIASTPVIGGHYLIDVVAGAALAIGAIAAAQWLSAGGRLAAAACFRLPCAIARHSAVGRSPEGPIV